MNKITRCALLVNRFSYPRYRVLYPALLTSSICLFSPVSLGVSEVKTYDIDLERQSLYSALEALSRIAGFQLGISLDSDSLTLSQETIEPLKGAYTSQEVVEKILDGTGIQYHWQGPQNLSVGEKPEPPEPPVTKVLPEPALPSIEEISVTGSNIRGTRSASPLFVFDRKDIQNTGAKSVSEFLKYLPQTFGGGASEGAISSIKGGGADLNVSGASGINLRGLGNEATLTLLNGHRMAAVGFGDVVDISMIPLEAVERIDVLTDGASAIYGSDAVSGVVNIILRKNYEGAETRVGYGDVTNGSAYNYDFSQTVGKSWQSGNVFLNYSHQGHDSLSTEDRSFSESAVDPSDLLGENHRQAATLSLNQKLSEGFDTYLEVLYSERDSDTVHARLGGTTALDDDQVKHATFLSGFKLALSDSWNLDSSVLYTSSSAVAESDSGSFSTQAKLGTDIWVLDSIFEGEVFESSGGMAKLAVGGQYRLEKFTASSVLLDGRENIDRDISAVFAELYVPLVGKGNEQWGVRKLELTIAGRYEEYSDLGHSANPKLGLLWSPAEGVKFRSTYSRSFRAPLLYHLSEVTNPVGSSIYLVPDPLADSALTPALLLAGNNPELQAERATSWTLGADITPSLLPSLQVSLTYFNIDYADQIQKVISPAEGGNVLSEKAYESFVTRSPDVELINFWASQPNFRNPLDIGLEDIEVLVDNRLYNILSVRERGLDFEINHWINSVFGEFIFQIGGTYLLNLNSQLTDTAESVELLNTPYNPVDLKLRNSVVWNLNDITASLAIYYVDSYKDKRDLEYESTIPSWTTVDLNVRYNMDWRAASWLNNTTFSLSVSNLFDRQPPFVANSLGYNFDAANASAMGRRISIDISKRW